MQQIAVLSTMMVHPDNSGLVGSFHRSEYRLRVRFPVTSSRLGASAEKILPSISNLQHNEVPLLKGRYTDCIVGYIRATSAAGRYMYCDIFVDLMCSRDMELCSSGTMRKNSVSVAQNATRTSK
jgi:hypothetical protein